MKHEAIVEGRELPPRDTRIDVEYDIQVHCTAGDIDAQVLNVSSDGFRLRSLDPLEVGWEVTLKAPEHNPVKAVICWACGLDSGGVFADPVAL
jgi:PilZ domain